MSYNWRKNPQNKVSLEEIVGLIGGLTLVTGALIFSCSFKDSKADYTTPYPTYHLSHTNHYRSIK